MKTGPHPQLVPSDYGQVRLPGLGSVINGQLRSNGPEFTCENPANGQTICVLSSATEGDVHDAILAARSAFEGAWGLMSPGKRQKILSKLARLIEDHLDELALLESTENGIPLMVVRNFSVAALAKNIAYYASWIDKLHGSVVPLTTKDALDYVVTEPFGVVGVVTAYNTPSLFLGSKVGPALAAGNCVVIKPSPYASLPALRFAELVSEAGLPDGAVNVVLGGAEVGSQLAGHSLVDLLSFTGSGRAGRQVSELAAANLTPVALELGGKSPDIVFEDADIAKASTSACLGAFALSGQACVAGSRLLVHRSIKDQLIESLVKFTESLPVGNPQDPGTVIGPLISASHRDWVESIISRSVDEGAQIVCGATRPNGNLSNGYYLYPGVISNVRQVQDIYRQEVFGPVITVSTFESENEAVVMGNDTNYGLGAGIWTRDIGRAHRVASRLRAGSVWINSYGVVPHVAPFGGYKDSGSAREGGIWGLMTYLQHKNIYVDLK